MYEQLNLFDLFQFDTVELTTEKKAGTRSVKKGANAPMEAPLATQVFKDADSMDCYLNKGDKILDLAKKQYASYADRTLFSDWEEKLWDIKFPSPMLKNTLWQKSDDTKEILSKIARSVTRPVFRAMKDVTDDDESVVMLRSMLPDGMTAEFQHYTDMKLRDVERKPKEGEELLRVVLAEPGYPVMTFVGLKVSAHSKSREDAEFRRSKEHYTDLAKLFALLIVIKTVNERLLQRRSNKEHSDILDNVCKPLTREDMKEINKDLFQAYCRADGECLANAWFKKEDVECMFEKEWIFLRKISSKWQEFIGRHFNVRVRCEPTVRNPLLMKREYEEVYRGNTEKDRTKLPILFGGVPSICKQRFAAFVLDGEADGFSYALFRELDQSALLRNVYALMDEGGLYHLFLLIAEENHAICTQRKYLKELSGDYARSYQTKKNIPKATLSAMKESYFNTYFGYVEYDETVDLNRIEELQKEFAAVKEVYLKGVDATQNAIRFRRLGNHKAAGLYYPSVKCLCVDVSHPDSMIHEFGHLIDYEYGSLSMQGEFSYIRKLYSDLLKSDERTKQLKGKYNLDYYLMPTEIFARSFELYMLKVKGVDNSILKTDLALFAYPKDETYLEAVSRYFDTVLSRING